MILSKAKKIADRVIEVLSPHCEPGFIHIAGSVRREKADVKDLEICCIAKREFIQSDLFGGGETCVSPGFVNAVNSLAEQIIKGNPSGRYMQVALKNLKGFKLDLFMPQPEDYFRIYVIRTGSKEYVKNKIAEGWLKLGWAGTNMGLCRISDCIERRGPEKKYWACVNINGEKPRAWVSEEDFFEWLQVVWIPPYFREWKDESFKKMLYK